MLDTELRLIILGKYYDKREEDDFIPVNNDYFGDEFETLVFANLCLDGTYGNLLVNPPILPIFGAPYLEEITCFDIFSPYMA